MTATSRELWKRVSGLRSWDRTAGIEKLGQDTRTRQPEQDSQDKKAGKRRTGTGKSERQLSCACCPVTTVFFSVSCPGCTVLTVLSGYPVLAIMSRLSYPSCPEPAILSQ
jgi:hypothetical protein